MARKCSTPFVEPPVVAMERMALSRAERVMICEGVRSWRTNSTAKDPTWVPTASLRGSVAGTEPEPMRATPRISAAVAMVLAVN